VNRHSSRSLSSETSSSLFAFEYFSNSSRQRLDCSLIVGTRSVGTRGVFFEVTNASIDLDCPKKNFNASKESSSWRACGNPSMSMGLRDNTWFFLKDEAAHRTHSERTNTNSTNYSYLLAPRDMSREFNVRPTGRVVADGRAPPPLPLLSTCSPVFTLSDDRGVDEHIAMAICACRRICTSNRLVSNIGGAYGALGATTEVVVSDDVQAACLNR